jgi:hypothetical protein
VNLEGGCWALETAQGTLEPINLPADYRRDGLKVRVAYHEASGIATICMIGRTVRIDTLLVR